MSRQNVIQAPPPAGLDLADFPVLSSRDPVYRAHSRGIGPWHFSNSGEGRFDLAGERGTCYLANTVGAAVRERLGEQFAARRIAAPEDAEKMVVSRLELPRRLRAADLESPGVGGYPITAELTSMSDYSVPQAWARAFDDAGFGGVHYRGRFSYFDATSWAVFGPAGPDDRRPVDSNPIDGFDACEEGGLTVLPAPPTDLVGLTVVHH
ncbi:RES family NAD+ phosphorylase [Agromyces sp. NPDC058484]|uniref:RES family NAD+ phosphorylase n=1 Tax=Agromyces sp. NPDC058484 TaxID=3346524 RepID=UPI0036507217